MVTSKLASKKGMHLKVLLKYVTTNKKWKHMMVGSTIQ
jgi:hypothetical protein